MGYDIKLTADIDSIDFSNLEQEKGTVRYSLDGSEFVISGNGVTTYTKQEMLDIVRTSKWDENYN